MLSPFVVAIYMIIEVFAYNKDLFYIKYLCLAFFSFHLDLTVTVPHPHRLAFKWGRNKVGARPGSE